MSNSVTPWTVAHQAPPSMGFSRQECWSGMSFPSTGDLPGPGIKPRSPSLQADALPSEPPGKPLAKCKSVSVRYYFTPISLAIIKKRNNNKCCRGYGEKESSYIVDAIAVKWYNRFEKGFVSTSKIKYRVAL